MSSTQDTSVGESMGNCQQRIGEKQRVALGLEKTAYGLWAGPLGTLLQLSCLETQGEPRSVLTGTWLVTGTLFHCTQIDFFFYAVIFFHPLNTALSTEGSKSGQAEQDLNH